MKKEVLLAVLFGTVVPLAMMAFSLRQPPIVEGETTAAVDFAVASVDGSITLQVLSQSGEPVSMSLGEYLTGVVLAEMPASFEEEALKAQAVVARTYTCRRLENRRHDGAVVCMDAGCCQGYVSARDYLAQGGERDFVEKIARAVADTDGVVLRYAGELIDATYFSCSGGRTEDAVAVWGRDVPYLQAVESPGEEEAPRYSDAVSFTADQFRTLTGRGEGNPADWFGAVTYTDGGGVETIEICGKTFTGVDLRNLLGLRSTAFSVSVEGQIITVKTRGFGHRVGMSQYGAQAMAEQGSSYAEILTHYYQGAELSVLNGG